jgi:hypothetical protein
VSLWWHRGRILRAVAGELSVRDETRLRAHLARCSACREWYDELSRTALALRPGGADERERARLLDALGGPPAGAAAPVKTRPAARRWIPALAVAAAAATAFALWGWPRDPAGVTWRGAGDEARPPVRLLLHASRKGDGPDGAPGPLRFVADLPGAGEARASVRDYLQLSYVGLRRSGFATVVAIDDAGGDHQYVPRPEAEAPRVEPTERARGLGPSVFLGRQRPGRFRLYAVFADKPVDAIAIREAAARAQASGKPASLPGVDAIHVSGVLILEPW